MTRSEAQERIDRAFDAHMEKLVDVLMANSTGAPDKVADFVGNFHRGLVAADHVHSLVSKELETIFPE